MAVIFNGEGFKLKYLFGCEFDDGQIYTQTAEDVSLTTPSKSAFYDIKDASIKRFWIEGEGHIYLVDLTDGHFEINNIPFFIHDELLSDFRLIYYRQHKHSFNQAQEQVDHEIEYHFGWQTTHNGENIKRIMRVK